jgi:hypothetical protein
MSQAGVAVVADDVLVLDGFTVLAGPRCLDLRTSAASRFGVGEPLGVIGGRERWRIGLGPVAAELPLHGWVALSWDQQTAIRVLRGAERLQALVSHRGTRLYPPDPRALIELSALPFLELRRARSWDSAEDAVQRLLDAIG